jgi:hypothetical protein
MMLLLLIAAQTGLQFGVEMGPYRPAIDGEFDGATPFRDLFGDKLAVMTRFRGAWLFDQPFGKIGGSISAGWAQDSARPLTEDGGRSGGRTRYQLVPVSAMIHLRADALADLIPIPLVPFGAVGLDYIFWRVDKTAGGSPGLEAILGVALLLDRLDAHSSKVLKETFGITGAELSFFGLYVQSLGKDRLHVGDLTWCGGLAVSF